MQVITLLTNYSKHALVLQVTKYSGEKKNTSDQYVPWNKLKKIKIIVTSA